MANKTGRGAQGAGTIREKTVVRNGKEYHFWEARATVGRDPLTGKQIQKSFSGKTQKEVQQKLTAALAEIDSGDYLQPSKLTLAAWLDEWQKMIQPKVSLNTYETYKSRIDNHIVPGFGKKVKLADVNRLQVQKFVDSLIKHGLAPKTVRSTHGVLSKALEDAERMELIKSNPAAKIELPRAKHKEVDALTDEEIQQFFKIADTRKYGNLLRFILLTGLRESEALGLCWDAVDFTANTITVRRQLQKHTGGYILLNETKSHKPRTIVLSASAMAILRKLKNQQAEQRFALGDAWEGWKTEAERKSYFCFTNENGRYITSDGLYACLKRIADKMGKPALTVHDLRHAYATLCLQNGDDLKTVSANLGHSTIAITADIYASVSQKMQNASAERMERFIQQFTA